MHSLTSPAPAVKVLAATIVGDLERDGYVPGVPPQVQAFARAVDKGFCRAMECGSCQAKGMKYRPFKRGTSYRVVAECPRCGAGEEV